MKFLVMNGVNLNLTGKREKSVYGTATLDEINAKIAAFCKQNGDNVEFYQSNIEGELVNKLHEAFLEKRFVSISQPLTCSESSAIKYSKATPSRSGVSN